MDQLFFTMKVVLILLLMSMLYLVSPSMQIVHWKGENPAKGAENVLINCYMHVPFIHYITQRAACILIVDVAICC